MNITSSYQVRIVNCSVNLIDTVHIYQKALSYLIGVVSENWDAVKSITTGALEQQRYIEKLVHGNKNREAKYQESVSLEPPAMTSFLSVLTFLKASTRYRIPFSGTRRPRNNMYESFFSPNLSVIRLASRICRLFTPLGIKCVSLP